MNDHILLLQAKIRYLPHTLSSRIPKQFSTHFVVCGPSTRYVSAYSPLRADHDTTVTELGPYSFCLPSPVLRSLVMLAGRSTGPSSLIRKVPFVSTYARSNGANFEVKLLLPPTNVAHSFSVSRSLISSDRL
jgi:hypothetical protein